jgi:adenosylmethionine-8-amino-7-oxononanoate aminotransferase
MIVRGAGAYLWDDGGHRLLDLTSGISVTALIGHGRPEVADAMAEQARRLSFIHNARVTNDRQEEFAARLVELAPEFGRVMLTSGGSEANELSLRIARQYHLARGEASRFKVISTAPSYHGATVGAMSMTGRADLRADYAPYLCHFPKIPYPITYRGPLAGLASPEAARQAAQTLADAIESEGPETVSAFVAEPISPSAGTAVPPEGWWPAVREVCDRYGVLLIADEIITGAGRTGTFLALEGFGVTADIVNLAKGIGAGYVPLGATLVRSEVADAIGEAKRRMGEVHTYSGAPLSCAIGLAVLDVIERDGLVAVARERGAFLRELLEERLGDLPWVGEIRGRGFLQAVEWVADRQTRAPLPGEARLPDALWDGMWRRGVLLATTRFAGPLNFDCTLFAPPLVVTEAELEVGVDALRETVVEVLGG